MEKLILQLLMKTKFKCPVCGKLSIGRLPKGGNGSFYYPQRHNVDGKPCPGNIEEAEWVTIEENEKK